MTTAATKHERRALLRTGGWQCVSTAGSETWTHDRYPNTLFTLVAATRRERADTPSDRREAAS